MGKTYLSLDIGNHEISSLLFQKSTGPYNLIADAKESFELRNPDGLMSAFVANMRALEAQSLFALLDEHGHLAHEGHASLEGLSGVGFSFSAARPIRVALLGISEAYSMASLRRLVSLFDAEIVLEIRLLDPQNQSAQLQALSSTEIEMVVIAGGAEEGASRALRNAIENIRLLYHLIPNKIQPQIVYAGNQVLADYARIEIEAGADFHLADSLRSLPGEEDLSVAWQAMLRAYERVRLQQFPQLRELQEQLQAPLVPASFAMGRIARFIAALNKSQKGVLLADLSLESCRLLLANSNGLMAINRQNRIDDVTIQKTQHYLSQHLNKTEVSDYLHNKVLCQKQFAVSISDFAIEQAWARTCINQTLKALKALNPSLGFDEQKGLIEACDPIILSGALITENLQAHQSLMVGLDGMMPHGISTFALDEKQILRALGTLAKLEPLLVVQLLELDSLRHLSSVVCVDSDEDADKTVLELEIVIGDDEPRGYHRVKIGELRKFDLGDEADTRVYLAPGRDSDIGMGMRGLGGWINVGESELGLIIDSRGRPLELPERAASRAEKWRDWLWGIGA